MSNQKRWKFEQIDYWLKSEEEIFAEVPYLDSSVKEAALSNIQEIIDKCNVDFTLLSGNFLPHFADMTKEQEDEALEEMALANYVRRVCERKEGNPGFLSDVHKELSVIRETGYSGYFLIVQEYTNWAKDHGILVGDGRGSGAGSKTAYTVGITEVNPQKYGLLFERFLSPGREPDFDIDFSDIDAVFSHLQSVYGSSNVARVGAYNRMSAKSAIRKIMGAFEFTQGEISKVVGYLPDRLKFSFTEALDESESLRRFFDNHDDLRRIIFQLEGRISHMTTHAGGVIICKELTSMLPVTVVEGKLVVEMDKYGIAELGHYKFDILGLESLSLVDSVLDNIEGTIEWHSVDYEDQHIYDMLCSGDVFGVFQLSEQKDKVVEQQPRSFEDLIAINALIRPGVGDWNEYLRRRRNNLGESFSRGLDYLESTAGVIVYQEQYLLLAYTYAGWDSSDLSSA
jgi:DNA polymerase-3 subunit alpha